MPLGIGHRRDRGRPAFDVELHRRVAFERAGPGEVLSGLIAAAADVGPHGQHAPKYETHTYGDDRSANEEGPCPGEQEAEADADDDQRPEPPGLTEARRAPEIGPRHKAQDDEEDSPVEPTAVNSHLHYLLGQIGRA